MANDDNRFAWHPEPDLLGFGDASASKANSRGADRIHEWPRARNTIASAKMMNPVHAIGVFHDQNGSIRSSVIVSETIMIAAPTHAGIT